MLVQFPRHVIKRFGYNKVWMWNIWFNVLLGFFFSTAQSGEKKSYWSKFFLNHLIIKKINIPNSNFVMTKSAQLILKIKPYMKLVEFNVLFSWIFYARNVETAKKKVQTKKLVWEKREIGRFWKIPNWS